MSRQRLMAVLGALALAILGIVGMVAYVSGAEDRAASGEIQVDVYVVDRRIPPGTPADRIPDFTTLQPVPRKLITGDTIGDLADIEGLVTKVELLERDVLSIARFVDPLTFERETTRLVERPEGFEEVTIALSPERAGGGLIVPGDTVGVIMSFDPFKVESDVAIQVDDGILPPDSQTNTTTFQALHKLLVTNVQLEEVPEVEEREGIEDEESFQVRLVPSGNLLVTLAVDVHTAERLIFGQEFGNLWLTLEPDDTAEDPQSIQNRGTVYKDFDEDDETTIETLGQ